MRSVDTDRYHPAFPNPDRPTHWPGEENHFRSTFQIGDVVRMPYGALGRITAFNNTWSHIRGGRLAHVEPILAYQAPEPANARLYGHDLCSERDLAAAHPGDVSAHLALRDGCQPWDYANGWRHVRASWDRPPGPTATDTHPPAGHAGRPDAADDPTADDDRRRRADGHGDGPVAP